MGWVPRQIIQNNNFRCIFSSPVFAQEKCLLWFLIKATVDFVFGLLVFLFSSTSGLNCQFPIGFRSHLEGGRALLKW